MDNKFKKLKGFTIIELLVVVAIISVLASIGVPAAMTWIRDSKITKANSNAQLVYTAAQDYLTQLEIKNTPISGLSVGSIYCASDSNASSEFTGTNAVPAGENTSVYGIIDGCSAENFGKTLGDSFEGTWYVTFNRDTYTVRNVWWTEIPQGQTSTALSSASMYVYATYAEQEVAYRSTGKIIGQFPIQ